MPFDNITGGKFTGASVAAREKFDQALWCYQCLAGDPLTPLDEAIADSPGFVMAYVLKGHLLANGSNADCVELARQVVAEAAALPMNAHEQAHVAALAAFTSGRFRKAARILEDVSIEHPTDVLALEAGQMIDFLLGDSRMLRDRIARAMPHWSRDMPGYHAVLGMHAFGLEEMGHYARAEAAGRESIELEPRNSWAQHAVAHVLEMQDRREDGIVWMTEDTPRWAEDNFFKVHNWWHLGLFHLGLGQPDEAVRIYDQHILGEPSEMAFDMVDASAMLWRLSPSRKSIIWPASRASRSVGYSTAMSSRMRAATRSSPERKRVSASTCARSWLLAGRAAACAATSTAMATQSAFEPLPSRWPLST